LVTLVFYSNVLRQLRRCKRLTLPCSQVTYRRGKNTFNAAGNIVLLEALARSLRSAAIRRSLNVLLSVSTFPRATRFVSKVGQTKIVAAKIQSPVPEPMTMICPRPVDINVVDENVSTGQIDESEDAIGALSAGDLLEGTSDTKRICRWPILSAIGRRLSNINV